MAVVACVLSDHIRLPSCGAVCADEKGPTLAATTTDGTATGVDVNSSYDPIADPAAVVLALPYRFTVLRPCVIRIEKYSASTDHPSEITPIVYETAFEDDASLAVVNRRLPVPPFTVSRPSAETVVVTTSCVEVHVSTSGSGTVDATLLRLPAAPAWSPEDIPVGNLKGTYRQGSLDCYSAPQKCIDCEDVKNCAALGDGLLSRRGWAVHDDTLVPRTTAGPDGWLTHNRSASEIDLYLFAHGNTSQQFREVCQCPHGHVNASLTKSLPRMHDDDTFSDKATAVCVCT